MDNGQLTSAIKVELLAEDQKTRLEVSSVEAECRHHVRGFQLSG